MTKTYEEEIVCSVEDLAKNKDYGVICFDIAKYFEVSLSNIYMGEVGSWPRNMKSCIDELVLRNRLNRVMGYKLHTVRELRNCHAHGLSYIIYRDDAYISSVILNEFIRWLYGGEHMRIWLKCMNDLVDSIDLLRLSDSVPDKISSLQMIDHAILKAAHVKINNIGLDRAFKDNFSVLKTLSLKAIDVRSLAWMKVSQVVRRANHYGPPTNEDLEFEEEELNQLLSLINILKPETGVVPSSSPPQVDLNMIV